MPITDSGLGTFYQAGQPYLDFLMTDFYLPRVNDAKNNAAALLGYIPESSDRIAGKFIIEPVKFGRNTDAMIFVNDEGKLPDPGQASALTYAYRTRTMFCRVLVSGAIMRASGMDIVKYVDVIDDIMQQKADDMAVEMNRILHNDGSGRVAEIASGVASATQTFRLNQDIESPATCSSPPTQFLYENNRIAIFSPDGLTLRGIRTVSSVASDGITATLDSIVTTTTGDWVVRAPGASYATDVPLANRSSGFRHEPMGIAGIFSDAGVLDGNGAATGQTGSDDFTTTTKTFFQGINVANNPFNQGIVLSNAGVLRTPTEELMQQVLATAEKTNNAMIEMWLSNYGERLRYGETLMPDKRYSNTLNLRGGWTALDASGVPWVVDRMTFENRIYGCAFASAGFTQHVETTLQPLDPLGPHWYRLQDDDKYQAAYVTDFNIGVGVRQRTGALLTDVETVVV